MKTFGIDISRWQSGIDFKKVKSEGVNFIILRAMYHTTVDKCFEEFYQKAKEQGIGVGAYLYSMANTRAEAETEADELIKLLSGKQFEYPIYFDIEDKTQAGLSKDVVDSLVHGFCEKMEKAGYYAGFYCNTEWYMNHMNGAKLAERFTHWRAQWSKTEVTAFPMWQFGGESNYLRSNKVAGMTCDQNYCFKDFPTIIKNAKLNGFGTIAVKPSVSVSKPVVPQVSSYVGKTVKVGSGATYGGLTSARGQSVPEYIIGKPYEITKVEVHKGVEEALLKGLNSWIALSYLVTSNTPVASFNAGDKVKVVSGAKWSDGHGIPSWVFKTYPFYVRSMEDANGNHTISIYKSGEITGRINKKYLKK